MAKHPRKGVAGKNTGSKTRKAISTAKKRGASTKQIATAGMRSASTINQIEEGTIFNPPANLAGKINKAKTSKSKTRMTRTKARKR